MSIEDPIQDHDAEFAAAFNEGEGSAATAPTDDAPTGEIQAEEGQAGGGAPDAEGVAVVLNEDKGQVAQPVQSTEDDAEKERQRLRSWEGRLRAQQAELDAKAAKAGGSGVEAEEASDALEGVAQAAEASGSSDLANAANAAAEAVESGEMSPEEAVAQLSEDFGEEFIKMIKAIVVATTRKEVEPVTKTVDDVVSSLNSKEERAHFQAIASKHPDFGDIGKSDDFKSFVQALPDDVRGDAERVAKGGAAEEVIALLDAFKEAKAKSQQTQAPANADSQAQQDQGLEAMEGVRSGGVRLPEKPAPAEDDYEGAWKDF